MAALPKVLLTNTANNLEVTGQALKGNGYDGNSDGLHTIAWTLNDFRGRIKIQGTLDVNADAHWSDLDLDDSANGYIEYTTATTGTFSYNLVGNWVWLRAVVSRSHDESLTVANSGAVTNITYNY